MDDRIFADILQRLTVLSGTVHRCRNIRLLGGGGGGGALPPKAAKTT